MAAAENERKPDAQALTEHPYLALMCLYLSAFTGLFSETSLTVALPQLSVAFGVDLAIAQWLVVGYMLVIGLVLPFASVLMKWVPARKLTLFALGAFFCGSLISGFAPTFAVLLAGRLVQGICTGLVLPMMFAVTLAVMPPEKFGTAMGVSGLVIMFAPVVGPTLSGLIVDAISWRAIFFAFAICQAVALVFALKFAVSPYSLTRPGVDKASILLSCLGFGGLVLGAGIASLFGWISVPTLGALVVGIGCIVGYVLRQLHLADPVLDLRAFAIQGFRIGAICMMFNFCITLSAMYVLPQFLQNGMLLGVAFAGLIMLPGGIVTAVFSTVAGKIFDRIGARVPALTGFAISIFGLVLLFFADEGSSLAYIIACHILLMLGGPLTMAPSQSHALASLPDRLATDGSTILNTLTQVGGAVCTAIATSLLAFGQSAYYGAGGTDGAAAFALGSHYAFILSLVLAVAGFIFAWRIKPIRRPEARQEAPGGESR